MGNTRYSEEEKAQFIELSALIGSRSAREELGFPRVTATGRAWMTTRGICEPSPIAILSQAQLRGNAYTDVQMLEVGAQALDRIADHLLHSTLDAGEVRELSYAYERLTNAYLKLAGRPTTITQTMDSYDAEIAQLLSQEVIKNNQEASTRDAVVVREANSYEQGDA